VLVYPRVGYPVTDRHVDGMELVEAPTVNISSTFIRDAIGRGRDMSYFLPQGVYKYIIDNKLYETTKVIKK
jgi:nicotinate-nucleotide adenylyltransferase